MATANHDVPIDAALTHYFEQLDQGVKLDLAALIAQFPDCAEELEQFFANERQLNDRLAEISSQSGSARRLKVRCPNCHQPTEVATDTEFSDLTCRSCGSRFGLIDDATITAGATPLLTVGRFELVERLGMGAFGTVWKARDKELDRTVAVKIPRQSDMSHEDQEKFLREARAAAQLSHPNIVSVHEVGRDGGTIYIVSDFVRGLTLADWLTSQQPSNRESAELCATVADALHHAHEKGVVHRDLKPGNIMLDGDLTPHIMDFGLARREAGEVTVTMDGHVLGTPAYMSPEQAQGESHAADRRSDVYSLGVILYQLLTGELPFRGNARMLMHQVIHDEPPSPRKLNANIKRDLETIALKCLEKEPGNRYQNARYLTDELLRFLDGKPIHARPIGLVERGFRWSKRKPAIAALSTAVVALLLGTLGVLAVSNARVGKESAARAVALEEKDKALGTAKKNEDMASRRYYAAQMNLASQSWRSGDHARTVQLLETLRPKQGETDRRGFEWRHLYHLAHANVIRRWRGHTDNKTSVIFDMICPAGADWFASASSDGLIRFWNVRTGRDEGSLSCDDWCLKLAVSPDRSLMAAALPAGNVSTAILWDLHSKREICRWKVSGGDEIQAIAISPHNDVVATGMVGSPGALALWDVQGNRLPAFADFRGSVKALAFSPDGTSLAVGGSSDSPDKSLTMWSMGNPPDQLSAVEIKGVNDLEFSADGKTLWCAAGNSIVDIDPQTFRVRRKLSGHGSTVQGLAVLADQRHIVSASGDRTIRMWDTENGQSSVIGAERSGVYSVATSSLENRVASGDIDGWITLRDFDVPSEVPTLNRNWIPQGGTDIGSIQYSSDGGLLYVGSSPLNVVDADSLFLSRTFPLKKVLSISSDCQKAASFDGQTRTLEVWNLVNGSAELTLDVDEVGSALFSPDCRFLATWKVWRDDALRLWDTHTGQSVSFKLKNKFSVQTAAFSPNGQHLALGTRFYALSVWDIQRNSVIDTEAYPLNNRHVISALVYANDGSVIAAGFSSGNVVLWDVDMASGQLNIRGHLHGHTNEITSMLFSPDGSRLVTAARDGSVRIWDIVLGQETITFDIQAKLLAFSSQGNRLAIVDDANQVQVLKASVLDFLVSSAEPEAAPDSSRGIPSSKSASQRTVRH